MYPGMQCPRCGSSKLARSHARGLFENGLYLWGAEICRCLECCSRGAFLESRLIPLRAVDEGPNFDPGMASWIAVAGGILTCLAIGALVLAKFHRLPF